MSQMAPMNWTSLYVYFLCIYMLIVIMNYFMIIYPPNKMLHKTFKKKINWKW